MHIWFIMDGNRRWATSQNLTKILWHSKWWDNVENVLRMCLKNWVEHVSMWVIAKKNLEERSTLELNHLYKLIRTKLPEMLPKFNKNWVRFETIWDPSLLPEDIQKILSDTENDTVQNNKMVFIFAIWYGWQDEIVRWVKNYIKHNLEEIMSWKLEELMKKLDENEFAKYLDTGKYPPPDLIVRTWWDMRMSWYFLYQSEYSEMYFTKTLWPDFDDEEFNNAISSFKWAKRNFWK